MIKPYFRQDGFTLYHSDCLKVLQELKENSVDMLFADPPYRLSNDGVTCVGGEMVSVNKADWDRSEGTQLDYRFYLRWIRACRRVLKPGGTIWIIGSYHSIYMCGFALQWTGFHILNDICTYHTNAPPNLSCKVFTASHETLIWAVKDGDAQYTFNYELMKNGKWDDALKRPNKQMRSVWAIGRARKSEREFGRYPTQKPIRLIERVILASTNEGDLIVDPFTGTSTTGIVARRYDRKFIGIDNEKEALDISIRRYNDKSAELSE